MPPNGELLGPCPISSQMMAPFGLPQKASFAGRAALYEALQTEFVSHFFSGCTSLASTVRPLQS